jgi:hypothetical protein
MVHGNQKDVPSRPGTRPASRVNRPKQCENICVSEIADALPALDLLIGGIIVIAILLRTGFERAGVPALVGFIALGFLLRVASRTTTGT